MLNSENSIAFETQIPKFNKKTKYYFSWESNVVECNDAINHRINITADFFVYFLQSANKKKKRRSVTFNEEEIIINPEDINPAIGRFRNLIQTTVVPAKRIKLDSSIGAPQTSSDLSKHMHPNNFMPQLYEDLPPATGGESSKMDTFSANIDSNTSLTNLGSKLGILFPNPAPEVAPTISEIDNIPTQLVPSSHKCRFPILFQLSIFYIYS